MILDPDMRIDVKLDKSGMAALERGPFQRAVVRALGKAGSTALRDMRAEATKRIRTRKRIAGKYISRAITMRRPKGSDIASMAWTLAVSGEPVPLVAYPHRQTRQGVRVEVNRGKQSLVKGAFVATMKSGHEGVFKRQSKARLPIAELLGSRPVDALLHAGEAQSVADRGGKSLRSTFARLLPVELGKGK